MKTWFKHDYNARNDEKLVNLSMNEGLEGLAIYWCLIEMLYENNGSLDNNCERIAFALHSQKDKINKIINGYSLFKINKKQNIIFCDRVLSQLKEIDNISKKARIGAKIKWNKYYANAKRSQCDRNATAMQIEKRREEKKEKIEKIEKNLQATPAEEIIPDLLNDKQKYIQIIGLWARAKKINFTGKAHQQSFIRRNLRAAQNLVPYDINRIMETMAYLIKNADFKSTLESVGKFIDEDLVKLHNKNKTIII